MTKAYTKELSRSLIDQWIISRTGHKGYIVFKCLRTSKKGHRIWAIPFAQSDPVELKTRQFRLASEAEVAQCVSFRIDGVYTEPPVDVVRYLR